MPSTLYLEAVLEKAKEYLPDWLWKQLHRAAFAQSGGKARWASNQPSLFEKLALTEMRPSKLRNESDDEIKMAWLRLNQWYSSAKKRGRPVEDIVNAAIWVMEEMDRRGFKYKGPLAEEAKGLKKFDIPSEIVVVPHFVSIVGSSVDKDDPNDTDVLIRAEIENDKYFKIRLENIWLPLRKVFDPNKEGKLHLIDNPSGPHSDYIPCYSLVLRREAARRQVVKEDGVRLDLGCGNNKPDGYIGIDKDPNSQADIIYDLELGIPYADNSVDEVRAYHILEHLDPDIMKEIYRVLKPGGRLVFEVPSTDGRGAFAHPEHKSFWNIDSFAFWTEDRLLEDRPKFDVEKLEETRQGDLVYVHGILRKPILKYFDPPKPEMAFYTEFYTVDELWDKWAKDRMPIAVEPKLNGFRAIWERNKLWFEGEKKDVSEKLGIELPDLVLDCDVAIERDGRRLPRNELNVLNSDDPLPQIKQMGGEIVVTAFDILWDGEDLKDKPFIERRKKLEELSKKYGFEITPMKIARDKDELEKAAKWAFDIDRSEGLVAKTLDGEYEYHSTNEWAKIKRVVELKVIVLDVATTKSGQYNYSGGVLDDVGFENVVELGGKKYVNLGETFNTSIRASVGDIITCQIHELIPNGTLAWLGATVIDVDKTRKVPYTAKQSMDIARRGQVLQKSETPEEMVEEAYRRSMEKFGEPIERHTISEIVRGKLYRVNDGWGERYYLIENGRAKHVAVKMPDVLAFHVDGPPIDKDWVKEHGWSDAAWDRALRNWIINKHLPGKHDQSTHNPWKGRIVGAAPEEDKVIRGALTLVPKEILPKRLEVHVKDKVAVAGKEVIGVYKGAFTDKKVIELNRKYLKGRPLKDIQGDILHETGHAVFFKEAKPKGKVGNISKSAAKELALGVSYAPALDDPAEAFAEAFAVRVLTGKSFGPRSDKIWEKLGI